MKLRLLSLFLFFIPVLPCPAQPPGEEPVLLDVEIAFLLWEDVTPSLWIRSGEELLPLRGLSAYRRSRPVRYKGPEELTLYAGPVLAPEAEVPEAVPVTPEMDRSLLRPVGTVMISENLRQPLLILFPQDRDAKKIVGKSFEDHPSDFPFGTFKFFNMSRQKLNARLGENAFQISPGQTKQVDPDKGGNGVLGFQLAYEDEDGENRVVQDTVYRYRIRRREIVFIRESPTEPGRFDTKSVMEYLPFELEDSP